MAREFDTHFCAVQYRTARMAAKDAERLRSCGWRVLQGYTDDPCVLHVYTYKPRTLFGHEDLRVTTRPTCGNYFRESNWRHGIVGWSLACGCDASRLDTDYRLAGVQAHLQPMGRDGKVFFGGDQYVIERMSWSCAMRDDRVNVCVRTLDDDGWRGRMIMVAGSVIDNLLKESAA